MWRGIQTNNSFYSHVHSFNRTPFSFLEGRKGKTLHILITYIKDLGFLNGLRY